jgi:hypothetical protein
VLRTHTVRSDLRAISVVRSSDAAVWTNTKDASPTAMLVPMPMLMFDLKSAGSMTFAGSTPIHRAIRKSSEGAPPAPGNDWGAGAMPLVAELPSEAVAVFPEAPDMGEPPGEAKSEPQPPATTQRIELIIDSLPRHELIESIPITVDSLGDEVFTATVGALNVTGTGNSLGDALIIVKEQIEILYEKLSKSTGLDDDENKYLTYLQCHIKDGPADNPRHSKRSIWR